MNTTRDTTGERRVEDHHGLARHTAVGEHKTAPIGAHPTLQVTDVTYRMDRLVVGNLQSFNIEKCNVSSTLEEILNILRYLNFIWGKK